MSRIIITVPFLALVIVWHTHLTAAQQPLELCAMAYNIGSAARIPLGPAQLDQIAAQIVELRADLVGMTEVDIGTDWHDGRDMVGELAVALARHGYPMHRYFTPTLRYHGGWMVLVLWSRFPILETGYRITVQNENEDWKVAQVAVQLPDGRPLRVFMTHYWIGDGSKHQHQTDTITTYVHEFEGPKILMGDFNLTPDSPYFRQILASGLEEACLVSNATHCPTVSGRAGEVAPQRLYQIDYIFSTRDLKVTQAFVPDKTVSDHWPVVARLTLAPSAEER